MFTKTLRRGASALALSAAFVATQAAAEGHGFTLEGKTVEWIIPFSETGGSAKWANFYAPLLSEALPGEPTVVVTFMPGAGSTKGANHFQGLEYDDGTTIFGSSGLDPVPVPAQRSARALRIRRLERGSGLWHWRRRLSAARNARDAG